MSIAKVKIAYFESPEQSEWSTLITRPVKSEQHLQETVSAIMRDIKQNGDEAAIKYTQKFDGVQLTDLAITEDQLKSARDRLDTHLVEAIEQAYENIKRFHLTQRSLSPAIDTMEGVTCWREYRPIDPVGLYIPGGTAPLFSTVLMLGIPAQIAGCHEVVLCSPPDHQGKLPAAICYAAQLCGISQIFRLGGVQAIAAMTFGTEQIPRVAKIFGPGNQWVTAAKTQSMQYGVAIDMPAGPSEVLVISDASSHPEFLAADMLSQAEHGSDSQVMLLGTDKEVIKSTLHEIDRQISALPRQAMAEQALAHSKALYFKDLDTCFHFSNLYAPEHLIVSIDHAEDYTSKISTAGSVFLGHYSPESVGDYASGTNHTLPTNGWARSYSGVSLDSFVKKITFQQLTKSGLRNIAPTVQKMAEAESLIAHRNAVSIRLKKEL